MKISTRVRYGIKALSYIAEAGKEGRLVRIKEISDSQNISVQYLEQILFKLKNEKIIEGKRGPNGGYKLSKEPEEITLHNLYTILDEESKVIDCNENTTCTDEGCDGSCIWSKLDNAMTKILEETTLEELLKNKDII
ncbi:MAG: Rrf2 family transcriptional regulator [Cetobacterium sp.]|uniref:Transcriptional regulator, BadM/Rrf2 family n=1 Tax=Cetobacterium ceti TaxID=180163 RepID=A0A1T4NZ65_9FUSO|nr:Rrf2 family transcriptional regulator [Cetobacterium ceti]MCJ8341276.1 Rrf2 family transcriptional regulator [Cetobacterium sp.]SJZ84326.1 transcriptional regulator, BadM/Rrf2 family [Cetobacterium ceti]